MGKYYKNSLVNKGKFLFACGMFTSILLASLTVTSKFIASEWPRLYGMIPLRCMFNLLKPHMCLKRP